MILLWETHDQVILWEKLQQIMREDFQQNLRGKLLNISARVKLKVISAVIRSAGLISTRKVMPRITNARNAMNASQRQWWQKLRFPPKSGMVSEILKEEC
jgi:hypothetical protein